MAVPSFQFPYDVRDSQSTAGFLSITTDMLTLVIEGGCLVYVKDNSNNEVLVNTTSTTHLPNSGGQQQGLGFNAIGYGVSGTSWYTAWPLNSRVASGTPPIDDDYHYRLVYANLENMFGEMSNTSLTLDIAVDETVGDVTIKSTGIVSGGAAPYIISFPVPEFNKSGFLSGDGVYWAPTDADGSDNIDAYNGLMPAVVVGLGTDRVLSMWSEDIRCLRFELDPIANTNGPSDWIYSTHNQTPYYDIFVCSAPRDQVAANPQEIIGGPWRIGTHPNWWTAADRWRTLFEVRTGAKPLWNNDVTWCRDIHCYSDRRNQGGCTLARYDALATIVPINKMLFDCWNGGGIVLYGDPTYTTNTTPQASDWDYINNYIPGAYGDRWNVEVYHPYNMYASTQGITDRLAYLNGIGVVPSQNWLGEQPYAYAPDYNGSPPGDPGDFQTWWTTPSINFFVGAEGFRCNAIHPADPNFQDYFLQNVTNFMTYKNVQGFYFDNAGGDCGPSFAVRIQDTDYRRGERDAFAALWAAYKVPARPEYTNIGLIPYCWRTHSSHSDMSNWPTGKDINHPIRSALLGSYVWSRDFEGTISTVADGYNIKFGSLVGSLPVIFVAGDAYVGDWLDVVQKRAQLYCEFDLFHDIPTTWEDYNGTPALAYFRSNTGNMFRCEDRGSGVYAYVEEYWGGDYDRLVVDSGVVTTNNIDVVLPSAPPVPPEPPPPPYFSLTLGTGHKLLITESGSKVV